MKRKLFIANTPDTFRGTSCCNNTPNLVEWVHTDQIPSGHNEPVVLFDGCISVMHFDISKNNRVYGWLGESSEIIHQLINDIMNNKEMYKEKMRKIFTHDRRLIEEDSDLFEYCPPASNLSWIVDRGIHTKSKLCSYITSLKCVTSGHNIRLQLLKYLNEKQMLEGHIYGRNHNKIDRKEIALNDYMFTIVIENGNYPKYYTEKIMDAFTTGTVPLYIGTKTITEDFDEKGILFLQPDDPSMIDISILNRLSEDMYQSMMPSIQKNYEIACNMKMSDDFICERIMEDD